MSDQYTNQVLKVVVAQICQTIGYHSIQTTPLELMTDILRKYLEQISKETYKYAELYNRSEANLDDVGLAYKDMNINLSDIAEYIQYVDPVPCALDIPKYPLPKEPHLNFLKPGSKEVLTRPVYIHEYLPPVNPPSDEDEEPNPVEKMEKGDGSLDVVNVSNEEPASPFFKRPGSVSSSTDKPDAKKQKNSFEDEVKPIREISSVMMTTSGFISPAREGKLPDTKPPVIIPEAKPTPPPPPVNPVPAALPVNSLDGKFSDKKVKKIKSSVEIKEKEKKKEKIPKEVLRAEKLQKKLERQKEQREQREAAQQAAIAAGLPNFPVKAEKLEKSFPSASSSVSVPLASESHGPLSGSIPIPPIVKKEHIVLTERQEKPHNVSIPGVSPPKKLGRPRKDKSGEPTTPSSSKKYMKMIPKVNKAALQADMFASLRHPESMSFNPAPLGRGRPPLHKNNPNHPLHPNYVPPSQFPRFPGTSGFPLYPPPPGIGIGGHTQAHSLQEEKISSEPDKQKLNIFKKIPKIKDDSTMVKDQKHSHTPLQSNDQVIVIDDDHNSNPLPPTPSTPAMLQSSFKRDHDFTADNSYGSNVTTTKPPKASKHVDFNFGGKTPTPKSIPQFDANGQKIRKKYKTKEKLNKKMLMNKAYNEEMLKNSGVTPKLGTYKHSKKFLEKQMMNAAASSATSSAAAVAAAAAATSQQLQNMFPMFSLPSGPGLIPNQGLFPPFLPRGASPFGSNFPLRPAIPDMNLLFPRLRNPTDDNPNKSLPAEVNKPHCNVAPLVPESLKLEVPSTTIVGPSSSSAISPNKPHVHFQSTPQRPVTPTVSHPNELYTPKKSSIHFNLKPDEPIEIDESPPRYQSPPPLPKTPSVYIPDHLPQTPGQHISVIDVTKDYSESEDVLPPPSTPTPAIITDQHHQPPKLDKDGKKDETKKHKKDKKEKEINKIKKKKDKKEKIKNKDKEKADRKKEREEKKEGKEKLKKEKKEKRKEKERALTSHSHLMSESISSNDNFDQTLSSVPKLTLKLGSSPRPDTPDSVRKITIKNVVKDDSNDDISLSSPGPSMKQEREPSPELARISPLVTRPPKPPKPTSTLKKKDDEKSSPDTTISPITAASTAAISSSATGATTTSKPPNATPTPGRGRPKGSVASRLLNNPATPKLGPPIKPSGKTGDDGGNSSVGSGIASSGGGGNGSVGSGGAQLKSPKHKMTDGPTTSHQSVNPVGGVAGPQPIGVKDSEGNQVWICPACGRVDDGTPMIGCDGCDAWYHWVCVGIQVPPDQNEDWYCRVCIARKQESHGGEKKKKRKKKDKKDH